jgi:hypothetical protein
MQMQAVCQHQQRIDNTVLTDASVKSIMFRDVRLPISLAVMKCALNMSYVSFALITLSNFVDVMTFILNIKQQMTADI